MDLNRLLLTAKAIFESSHASYGLIGAFGMSVHGFQRATNDIDFLVDGDQRKAVERAFDAAGFSVFHSSDEVLQLTGADGQIDIIFANRPLSKSMLQHPKLPEIMGVACLRAEDIIGLKIQSAANNPKRRLKELADIQSLAEANPDLRWGDVKNYADLFGFWIDIEAIQLMVNDED